jgi:putative transposase
MTDTVEGAARDGVVPEGQRGRVGRPRRDAGEPRLFGEEQARRLLERARACGLEVTCPAVLLQQMVKSVLEAALAEELSDHLGYRARRPGRTGPGNSRNGTTSKTVLTDAGLVQLETPRNRKGTFEPVIVRKGQRRLDGIDKIVLGLYAKGMSTRDITDHLAEIREAGLAGHGASCRRTGA